MSRKIGISLPLSSVSGWGIYRLNRVTELLNDGRFRPCLLVEPKNLYLDPLLAARLAPIIAEGRQYRGQKDLPFPVFHSFGNDFMTMGEMRGTVNVGFFFIRLLRKSTFCRPERSEGSRLAYNEILRCAQNDTQSHPGLF